MTRQDKIDSIVRWQRRRYTDDLRPIDELVLRWQLRPKSDAEIDRIYVETTADVLRAVSGTQAGVSGRDQQRPPRQ